MMEDSQLWGLTQQLLNRSMSSILNVEIKANCPNADEIEQSLLQEKAVFKGSDHQVDTYFQVPDGRLKLRQGNIENSLIFYVRKEVVGIKTSNVELVILDAEQAESMLNLLSASHVTLVQVRKIRKIFFIDNVKFHIDEVEELGSFIEIEAINFQNQNEEELREQCMHYLQAFELKEKDCLDASYSDLILRKASNLKDT